MRIGISGGNGDLSGRIVSRLIANGHPADQLVVTSRNPHALTKLSKQGVVVKRADFSDFDSVQAAFEGCERVLMVSIKDPLFDIKGKEYHATAVAACAAAGVGHLMYTSAIGAFPYVDGPPLDAHAFVEFQLENSGCEYTVIRNGGYAETLEFDLKNAIENDDGIWYSSAGDGVVAWTCKDDIAQATAVILTMENPSRLYTLTADVACSFEDVASAVNEKYGTNIRHQHLSPEEYDRYLDAQGLDEVMKKHILFLHVKISEGHCSIATSDIQRLTGRAPNSYMADIDLS